MKLDDTSKHAAAAIRLDCTLNSEKMPFGSHGHQFRKST